MLEDKQVQAGYAVAPVSSRQNPLSAFNRIRGQSEYVIVTRFHVVQAPNFAFLRKITASQSARQGLVGQPPTQRLRETCSIKQHFYMNDDEDKRHPWSFYDILWCVYLRFGPVELADIGLARA